MACLAMQPYVVLSRLKVSLAEVFYAFRSVIVMTK